MKQPTKTGKYRYRMPVGLAEWTANTSARNPWQIVEIVRIHDELYVTDGESTVLPLGDYWGAEWEAIDG